MWLLNATTKHLKPFLPDQVPPYAILSHTWDPTPDNEVLFSDFSSSAEASCGERVPLEQQPSARLKRSWRKVELTCAQALCDGYAWVWIDTCCIDKSSSSELSEAINSMYAWYRDSGVCYAYLSDVPANVCLKLSRLEFRRSRWFTRGWTLQELLAPSKLVFFAMAATPGDGGWRSIGEKTELSDLVASITGIDIDILVDRELLCSASIAQRMSWASCRVTSRPEDMAYCLMGLFGVHMPMLYGEGAEKAFLRLQEEIMASSVDQSLFAWRDEDAATRPSAKYGLLASSPLSFRDSSRIVPYQDWQCRPPYQMTNRGLQ
ncbi:HET-domain-containing protein, partial [Cryphonectria parasitica EP155]